MGLMALAAKAPSLAMLRAGRSAYRSFLRGLRVHAFATSPSCVVFLR
jgi:hypothetical protein